MQRSHECVSGGEDSSSASYSTYADDPQALLLHGTHLLQNNRFGEGVAVLQRSLELAPDQVQALGNLAQGLGALHRYDDALAACDRALALVPDYAVAHCNRGNILNALGRPLDALAACTRAITLHADFVQAYCNRSNAWRMLKRPDMALKDIDRAVALAPKNVDLLCNRGNILRELSRPNEALDAYDRAIAHAPAHPGTYSLRGNALCDLHRFDEAQASYDRAIALAPDHAAAHWNKALLRLRLGDFAEGWRLYEWRWRGSWACRRETRTFERPLWLGETPLEGKTLLIHAEQGYGDTIQFSRYIPQVAEARLVVEVPRPLVSLLSGLPGCEDVRFVTTGDALPDYDLHCPMMSLPLACGARSDTIPPAPYLHADSKKRRQWRDSLGPGPHIGLAWAGSVTHDNDISRSIPLRLLEPLYDLPVVFHALQTEIRPLDADALTRFSRLRLHCDALHDFSDTAALIAEMDLVVTVDTATAHLAGALNVPSVILLPYASDWRWFCDRDDTPWYASATLLRQTTHGEWTNVISTVAARIAGLRPD